MEKRWIWPFELEEQIGSGGMGVVYRARYVGNNRRVALKLLPDHVAQNPTLSARFTRELEILKDLRHPNIVHCFGGTTEGDHWFYAMELVEGGTIESLLRERGKLSWEATIDYGVQTCLALEHAHAQAIIHRDVKPANLLLTKTGKIKLGDFGLALVNDGEKLTATGKTMGTFLYMSPEQIRGDPPLNHKTDLYSLGCVLFEMLTGKPPFSGMTAGEVLNHHLSTPIPRLRPLALDCPVALETLVLELIAKDRQDRPPDAMTVAKRLKAVRSEVVIKSELPSEAKGAAEARAARAKETPAVTALLPAASLMAQRSWRVVEVAILLLLVVNLVVMLTRTPANHAQQLWIRTLRDPEPARRVLAAQSIGELGPDAGIAVPQLVVALQDTDPVVRATAAEALGKMQAEAQPAITALMRVQKTDDMQNVRDIAANSLQAIREAPTTNYFTSIVGFLTLAVVAAVGFWYWKIQ